MAKDEGIILDIPATEKTDLKFIELIRLGKWEPGELERYFANAPQILAKLKRYGVLNPMPSEYGTFLRDIKGTILESIYPIAFALQAADNEIRGLDWDNSANPIPQELRDIIDSNRRAGFSIPYIQSMCSKYAAKVNEFLAKNGFDISLEDNGSVDSLYMASILSIIAKWIVCGKDTKIQAQDSNIYDAFKLTKCNGIYDIGGVMVAEIRCTDALSVYITMFDDIHINHFASLSEITKKFMADKAEQKWRLISTDAIIKCPKIDITTTTNLDWLIDKRAMDAHNQEWWISQAKQQTIFKMNESGFCAKSAVAVEITRSIEIERGAKFVVDAPFMLWIQDKNFDWPMLVGRFDYDSWKDPGEIDGN